MHSFNETLFSRFTCQRWLGRNIEDGATEKTMLGFPLPSHTSINDIVRKSQQGRSSSIGRHWTRAGDNKDENLNSEELQQLLGENINNFVRLCYRPTQEYHEEDNDDDDETLCVTIDNSQSTPTTMTFKDNAKPKQNSVNITLSKKYTANTLCLPSRHNLRHGGYNNSLNIQHREANKLLFGERQLMWTLQQIFYYGFKNRGRSSFRKQIFFWDYIQRIQLELKLAMSSHNFKTSHITEEEQATALLSSHVHINKKFDKRFVELVETISLKAPNVGKDGKMLIFLAVSLRDHLLNPHFVRLLSRPNLAKQFYENSSFFLNTARTAFLIQILATLDDTKVPIDSSFTKGL